MLVNYWEPWWFLNSIAPFTGILHKHRLQVVSSYGNGIILVMASPCCCVMNFPQNVQYQKPRGIIFWRVKLSYKHIHTSHLKCAESHCDADLVACHAVICHCHPTSMPPVNLEELRAKVQARNEKRHWSSVRNPPVAPQRLVFFSVFPQSTCNDFQPCFWARSSHFRAFSWLGNRHGHWVSLSFAGIPVCKGYRALGPSKINVYHPKKWKLVRVDFVLYAALYGRHTYV